MSTSETRVRFVGEAKGVLSLLEVESAGRNGLLGVLSRALFDLRVQIVRAESRVSGTRRVERLTVVEFDGAPIGAARRLEIQVGVLQAIEDATRVQDLQVLESTRIIEVRGLAALET